MQDNRQIFIYNLIKTAVDNLSNSPLEFVETTDFSNLLKGTKPRVALELLSDIKKDIYRGSVKTRTDGNIDYQMLCGFKVDRKADSELEYKKQMYAIPELIEDALQSINLPNTEDITGKNYKISVRKITTPTSVFTIDYDTGEGFIFFNGNIEYWKF